MPSRLKQMIAEEMSARFRGAENIIFVGYRGLSAGQMAEFRAELRKEHLHLRVVRNRITVRALAELGHPEKVKDLFDGPTAIMDGEDPVSMAKAAVAFAKRNKSLEVKGGLVEGEVLTAREVVRLSTMPNRQEMRAQLVGTVLGVGGRLVAALRAPGGRIAGALEAMGKKDETDETEAPGADEPQAA